MQGRALTAEERSAERSRLTELATEIVRADGRAACTLRRVAELAGVSRMTPYTYFVDKEALLTALAVQGFEEFAQALAQAAKGPRAPFAEMGVAYVEFAVQRPGMFRLMFGPAVADRSRSPELLAAIAGSTRLFESGLKSGKHAPPQDPVAGLRAWATVHGLATLAIDGMLPRFDPVTLARALAPKPAKPR